MSQRANQEQTNALRRPKIVYTQAFLDDPIAIETDARFDAESALRNADATIPIADRDDAEFMMVDLNAQAAQFYPVHMYRETVARPEFDKIIQKKRQINQLLEEA